MKLTFLFTLTILLLAPRGEGSTLRGAAPEAADSYLDGILGTECLGSSLAVGQRLYGGQSICAEINGEMVYYGLRSYPNTPELGYTTTRLETWSALGTHNWFFRGVGVPTDSTPPYLVLQGDGNLVFHSNTVGCVAKPDARGPNIQATVGGPLPDLLTVRDNHGNVLWKLGQKTLSNGSIILSGSTCYPDTPPRCVGVLKAHERLSWNDYVCEYASDGSIATRFGLDKSGLLGLWNITNHLQWRPRPLVLICRLFRFEI